jgi:hypothetical protein
MLKTINEVSKMLKNGEWLHVSGSEDLLKKLPAGNWAGGTIEYFMGEEGGVTTDEKLFVNKLDFSPVKISVYDENNIQNITKDAYENGFSIAIMPFNSKVLEVYAKNSPFYEGMFVKSIVGWVTGTNFSKAGQTPFAINGIDQSIYTNKAVVMHVNLPQSHTANIGIVNIFTPNENSPVVEFTVEETFVKNCLIDGKETNLAGYLKENSIDIKVPLVGAFGDAWLNASFFNVDYEKGITHIATPVFPGVKYHFGKPVSDYPASFNKALAKFDENTKAIFSCNCAFNYLFGELEGKKLSCFRGPASFGEIAYQLLNQTLVYLTVVEA